MKPISLCLFLCSYSFVFFFRRFERYVAADLQLEYNFTIQQIGLISSCVNLGYLFSRFIGGILSDKYNPFVMFFFFSFLLCLPTFLTSLSQNLFALIFCFFLIGSTAGQTFPAICKMLQLTVSKSTFGTYYSFFSGSHGVVGVLAPLAFPILGAGSWKSSIMVLVVIQIVLLLLCFLSIALYDTGLRECLTISERTRKENRQETEEKNTFDNKNDSSLHSERLATLSTKHVIAVIGLIGFANRVCRFSIDWYPIIDKANYTPYVVSLQQTGCMVGCFASGVVADLFIRLVSFRSKNAESYFANGRIPFFLALIVINGSTYCLLALPSMSSSTSYVYVLNFLFGLTIDAIYTIGGIIEIELVEPHESGMVCSIVSIPCQFGGFIAGYPVALLAQYVGWQYTHLTIGLVVLFTSSTILTLKMPKQKLE